MLTLYLQHYTKGCKWQVHVHTVEDGTTQLNLKCVIKTQVWQYEPVGTEILILPDNRLSGL